MVQEMLELTRLNFAKWPDAWFPSAQTGRQLTFLGTCIELVFVHSKTAMLRFQEEHCTKLSADKEVQKTSVYL